MARIKIEDLPRPVETLNSEEARAVVGGRLGLGDAIQFAANVWEGAGSAVGYVGDSVRSAVGGSRADTERTLMNFCGGMEGFCRTFSSFDAYAKAFNDFYGG